MVLCPGTIPALRSLASSQGKQRIRDYLNANLLRGNVGNRDVLRQMPEIRNVRLDGQALAKILRIGLQNAVGGAVAADTQ